MIPYGRQNITEADIAAVVETLRSDFLTQGPKIEEFERKFASYVGAPAGVAVNNATAGLHLAARALGVAPGQKVIVTPLTFASSANCIRFCGGDVEFCDIDARTYLMDTVKLEQKLAAAPRGTYAGVVVVDFAGYPHNMEEVRRIADRYGLWVIEDACHAPGAWWTDSQGERQLTGSSRFADCTVFSFHPVKHIATGEGGMVTTARPELLERLRLLRTHGITRDPARLERPDEGGWYYEMQELGYNYRLTDIQAALGISQLDRADAGIARRQEIARRYDEAFAGRDDIITPWRADDVQHAFHLYVVQVPDRRAVYDRLRAGGIMAQIHYAPLHRMPYYRGLYGDTSLPVVEEYYRHCLSLPMFPTLTDAEQERVIAALLASLRAQ